MTRAKAFLLLPLLLAAGCDRNPTEAEHGEPAQVELRDLDTGTLYASTEGTGSGQHWDGALPSIAIDEGLEVEVIFRDDDGDEIPLGGDYSAHAEQVGGASGILGITAHGDHLDLEGLAAGTIQIEIQLYHGSHSDWESPALSVTVVP